MPFSVKSKKDGTEYYLHASPAANGKTKLYYFSKKIKEGVLEELPEGREISENGNTGLPILKKKVS